jgi:hypothetical protein
MSKPWRMVTLHIGAWMTLACLWWSGDAISLSSLLILDWACLIVIGGCLETIAVRLKRIMAALRAKAAAH